MRLSRGWPISGLVLLWMPTLHAQLGYQSSGTALQSPSLLSKLMGKSSAATLSGGVPCSAFGQWTLVQSGTDMTYDVRVNDDLTGTVKVPVCPAAHTLVVTPTGTATFATQITYNGEQPAEYICLSQTWGMSFSSDCSTANILTFETKMKSRSPMMANIGVACVSSLVLFGLCVGVVQAAPVCQALVSANNDYYLASTDSTIVTRFTTDATVKAPAVLAPDGSKIAYVVDFDAQSVAVANASGVSKTFQLKPASDAVTDQHEMMGITWRANSVLQVERHVSPSASLFDHYTVPPDLSAANQIQRPSLNGSVGSACSLAPITIFPACVFGADITVAGDYVYTRFRYDGTTPVETFTIATGSTVTSTSIDEGFQITLVATNLGYYTLKVTFPGGAWQQGLVPIGGLMPLEFDGATIGLYPTFVTGGANVAVRKSVANDGDGVFEPAIAWRGQDAEVIAIERTATGKSLSVLEHSGTTTPQVWTSIGKGALPVSKPIDDMRFVSPNYALIHTTSEYALYPVTITKGSSGTATVVVGSKSALPSSITITPSTTAPPVDAKVFDWKCSGS